MLLCRSHCWKIENLTMSFFKHMVGAVTVRANPRLGGGPGSLTWFWFEATRRRARSGGSSTADRVGPENLGAYSQASAKSVST
jgi:hypothetical protein